MNTTTKVVTRKNLVHRSRDNTDENNRQYLILSTLPKRMYPSILREENISLEEVLYLEGGACLFLSHPPLGGAHQPLWIGGAYLH